MPGGKLPDIFISPIEAGKILGCGQISIETGLRNGSFPIGWAWSSEEKGKRGQWNYRIPREAFMRAVASGSIHVANGAIYQTCRLYNIWSDMRQRCTDKNHPKYHLCGGQGIDYAFEWEQFTEFEKWAYANEYREYMTLKRKNPRLGYLPENCKWVSGIKQEVS